MVAGGADKAAGGSQAGLARFRGGKQLREMVDATSEAERRADLMGYAVANPSCAVERAACGNPLCPRVRLTEQVRRKPDPRHVPGAITQVHLQPDRRSLARCTEIDQKL